MKIPVLFALAVASAVKAAPTDVHQVSALAEPVKDANVPKLDDPNFIGRILDAHWYWRRIHCAQDLTWDPELAKAAAQSVNACTKKIQHDRPGSNLSAVGPSPRTYEDWLEFARQVVHGWHEEELKYPYHNPHYEAAWGHFTQMVWRDSSRIGCALAHCPDATCDFPGRLYCFYENAGNFVNEGAFQQNVWGMDCRDPEHTREG
ncbi:PR-1-like protein [Westerdykella ornata]|uniref:PR-1-like protein n=1 Tax=Westerdykella ornata TaxID=318751 RepID=A0A6A6JRG2_WESOR|nr:PR-1-like protein [Westerdykella ornata]KAF2278835.1 PR-1-like protein [Westerdykella ornata]